MKSHQLINQTSGAVEYYTPLEIVDAARDTMGGIDLDPASCQVANDRIMATTFYTREHDGLKSMWSGRVWLNWPFGRKSNPAWVHKIVEEWMKSPRCVTHICCICYACTSEGWFQPLLKFPQCYLAGRTGYILPDGTPKRGNTKGSVVTYLGPNVAAFAYHFRKLGTVKIAI